MSLYDDDDLPQISSTAAAPGWSQARRIIRREKSETSIVKLSSRSIRGPFLVISNAFYLVPLKKKRPGSGDNTKFNLALTV